MVRDGYGFSAEDRLVVCVIDYVDRLHMTIQIHIDTLCQLLHRGMYFMYINSPLLVLRRGKKATIGA